MSFLSITGGVSNVVANPRPDFSPLHVGTWKTGLDRYPLLVPQYQLSPRSTALVIIDIQNRALKPEFAGLARLLQQTHPHIAEYLIARGQQLVVPNTARLLEFFRRHGLRVIFTTVGPALADGSDWISPIRHGYGDMQRATGVRSLHPVGTPAHAVIDELKPGADELVINKTTSSAFHSTGIDLTLRTLGIDTLVCTGLVTNACVELTARDAGDRGFKVVIVDDACVAMDQAMHDACLRAFRVFLGNVRTTEEVLHELAVGVTPIAQAG